MTPWTVAHQAPLSMKFPRQEYWSGLPFCSPGDLPDPGVKPKSSALQADSLLLKHKKAWGGGSVTASNAFRGQHGQENDRNRMFGIYFKIIQIEKHSLVEEK